MKMNKIPALEPPDDTPVPVADSSSDGQPYPLEDRTDSLTGQWPSNEDERQ